MEHNKMNAYDTDGLFKKTRDVVGDLDASVKKVHADMSKNESMDAPFVKVEMDFLLNVAIASDARLAKYAKLVYDSIYEGAIKRNTLSMDDINKILSRCKQVLGAIKLNQLEYL
jgi:hypothetical protein